MRILIALLLKRVTPNATQMSRMEPIDWKERAEKAERERQEYKDDRDRWANIADDRANKLYIGQMERDELVKLLEDCRWQIEQHWDYSLSKDGDLLCRIDAKLAEAKR